MTDQQEQTEPEFPEFPTVTGGGTDGSPVGAMGEGATTTGDAADTGVDTTAGTDEAPATDA